MAEAELEKRVDAATGASGSLLWRKLPFIAVLALAIGGVAYMNVTSEPLVGYWEFLAVATGLLCIVTGWQSATVKEERMRLVWKQALHWIAVFVAMNIVVWSDLGRLLPTPATSLVLLLLLALGSFLAGVSLSSLPICFLGVALALAVPAIAWFKQAALFLVLAAVFAVGLFLLFLPNRKTGRPSEGADTV